MTQTKLMDMQDSTQNKDLVSVKLFFDESIYHLNQIWLPPFFRHLFPACIRQGSMSTSFLCLCDLEIQSCDCEKARGPETIIPSTDSSRRLLVVAADGTTM